MKKQDTVPGNFHELKAKTLEGGDFDFSTLEGKRVLIVNTASECGYTPQYEDLQELYAKYGGDDFTVIGFPSNDFGGQEPGTAEEIREFCQKNYGVTFPMMEKVKVKGEEKHPVYRWLTEKRYNNKADAEIKWNFHKFLVDEKGEWKRVYSSKKSPLSEEIISFAKN